MHQKSAREIELEIQLMELGKRMIAVVRANVSLAEWAEIERLQRQDAATPGGLANYDDVGRLVLATLERHDPALAAELEACRAEVAALGGSGSKREAMQERVRQLKRPPN